MKLRQTLAPAPFASWKEYFYDGELQIVGGEVETDNQRYIQILLSRGFSIVNDDTVQGASESEAPTQGEEEQDESDKKQKTAKNKEAA